MIMARSIPLEAGLITGGAVRAVATIRSATVTALHGEATVSALNDPGMSTAKQKTVFTSAFRYLSKS